MSTATTPEIDVHQLGERIDTMHAEICGMIDTVAPRGAKAPPVLLVGVEARARTSIMHSLCCARDHLARVLGELQPFDPSEGVTPAESHALLAST